MVGTGGAARYTRLSVALSLSAVFAAACAGPGEGEVTPTADRVPVTEAPARPPAAVQRITPVLAVEAIEPVVAFWERLGFEAVNPARENGRLTYAAFAKDGLEVQYQTLAQMAGTLPPAEVDRLRGSTSLVYLAVDDLDAVIERLGGAEIVIPRRRTSWGADEIHVREPGGHIIGFASFAGR